MSNHERGRRGPGSTNCEKPSSSESFEIVDEEGRVVGLASRKACHGNPALLHRVVHVLVVNEQGQILLQKRSPLKDIQPGKWDTSVGGHLQPEESYDAAAAREMEEELGIEERSLLLLHEYVWRTAVESERVRTYLCRGEGPFSHDPREIVEVRFWSMQEVRQHLGKGVFTPNFEEEFARYLDWKGRKSHA
jgi:isopentenyl-diphosphate delta-isomerase type 1